MSHIHNSLKTKSGSDTNNTIHPGKERKNWIGLLRLRISIEHEVRIITASFDSSSKLLFEQVLNENVKP